MNPWQQRQWTHSCIASANSYRNTCKLISRGVECKFDECMESFEMSGYCHFAIVRWSVGTKKMMVKKLFEYMYDAPRQLYFLGCGERAHFLLRFAILPPIPNLGHFLKPYNDVSLQVALNPYPHISVIVRRKTTTYYHQFFFTVDPTPRLVCWC